MSRLKLDVRAADPVYISWWESQMKTSSSIVHGTPSGKTFLPGEEILLRTVDFPQFYNLSTLGLNFRKMLVEKQLGLKFKSNVLLHSKAA